MFILRRTWVQSVFLSTVLMQAGVLCCVSCSPHIQGWWLLRQLQTHWDSDNWPQFKVKLMMFGFCPFLFGLTNFLSNMCMHVLVLHTGFWYKLVFADLRTASLFPVWRKISWNICDVLLPHFLVLWDQLIRFQAEQTNLLTPWPVNGELFTGTILKLVQEPIKEDGLFLWRSLVGPVSKWPHWTVLLFQIGDGELLLWSKHMALCLSEYASPECSKPNHRRLQWIVSRRTAQSLHSYRNIPELPTIPEGGWDESERWEPCSPWTLHSRHRAELCPAIELNQDGLLLSVSDWCSHVTALNRPDLKGNPKLSGQLGHFRFLKKQLTHPPRHCTPQRFSWYMIKACFHS